MAIRERVFDRKPEKMQPLAQRGAKTTDSPKNLAAECDVVLSCVTNDAAAEAVILGEQGALAGAQADTILVGYEYGLSP